MEIEEEEDGEYESISDSKERKKKLYKMLNRFKSNPGPNQPKIFEVLSNLVITLRNDRDFVDAISLVDEYTSDIISDSYFKGCLLMEKGKTLLLMKKPEVSHDTLQEALTLFNTSPVRHTNKHVQWGVVMVLESIGDYHNEKEDMKKAYIFYNESWKEVFENHKNFLDQEECLKVQKICFNLISVCFLLGKTKEAITTGMKMICFLRDQRSFKTKFSSQRSIFIQKIAQSYYLCGYHKIANQLHERGFQVCPKGKVNLKNELIRDICMYYFHKHDYNEFEEYRAKLSSKEDDSELEYCSQIFHSEELRRMWNKSHEKKEEEPITCFFCKKKKDDQNNIKLLRCSRCQFFFYCGRECQKKDWWAGHKYCCCNLLKL